MILMDFFSIHSQKRQIEAQVNDQINDKDNSVEQVCQPCPVFLIGIPTFLHATSKRISISGSTPFSTIFPAPSSGTILFPSFSTCGRPGIQAQNFRWQTLQEALNKTR